MFVKKEKGEDIRLFGEMIQRELLINWKVTWGGGGVFHLYVQKPKDYQARGKREREREREREVFSGACKKFSTR
jgi:hypothetical protein